MRCVVAVSCLMLGLGAGPVASAHEAEPVRGVPEVVRTHAAVRPTIDVALLLDTSNSMDGLIHQAKGQLWTIVQRFASAKKFGQTPRLRVALFQYGNSTLPASEGYIEQVVPLTSDLDELSAALFALTTNGGDEYCGQVIDEALTRLDWSQQPGAYRAVFIAGNEPFSQGPVDYRKASKRAIEMGVVVNTIHCGAYDAGRSGGWAEGAALAEGAYFNIDQDRAVTQIACPQDAEILRLNRELNETFLWIGSRDERADRARNQVAQDEAAATIAESTAVARAVAKASPVYASDRDAVELFAAEPAAIPAMRPELLPEALQKLDDEQRVEKLTELSERRAELQKRIAELSVEREAFLAEAEQVECGATLGDAVVQAIGEQLEAAGFVSE